MRLTDRPAAWWSRLRARFVRWREPSALHKATDKRRLEDLLCAEGISRAKAQQIVARYFSGA